MENKDAAASVKGFTVPIDLLKSFRSDIRFIPAVHPTNGYILFDREMLKSILLSEDLQGRRDLARQLDDLYKAGGELVIMQR